MDTAQEDVVSSNEERMQVETCVRIIKAMISPNRSVFTKEFLVSQLIDTDSVDRLMPAILELLSKEWVVIPLETPIHKYQYFQLIKREGD